MQGIHSSLRKLAKQNGTATAPFATLRVLLRDIPSPLNLFAIHKDLILSGSGLKHYEDEVFNHFTNINGIYESQVELPKMIQVIANNYSRSAFRNPTIVNTTLAGLAFALSNAGLTLTKEEKIKLLAMFADFTLDPMDNILEFSRNIVEVLQSAPNLGDYSSMKLTSMMDAVPDAAKINANLASQFSKIMLPNDTLSSDHLMLVFAAAKTIVPNSRVADSNFQTAALNRLAHHSVVAFNRSQIIKFFVVNGIAGKEYKEKW
jgi:hypothetical protein